MTSAPDRRTISAAASATGGSSPNQDPAGEKGGDVAAKLAPGTLDVVAGAAAAVSDAAGVTSGGGLPSTDPDGGGEPADTGAPVFGSTVV